MQHYAYDHNYRRSCCAKCEGVFDGDTRFIDVNDDKYCEECVNDMTTGELLELLDVEFKCIGWPEPEKC